MLLVAKNIISDSNLFFYLYNFSQSTTFEYNSTTTYYKLSRGLYEGEYIKISWEKAYQTRYLDGKLTPPEPVPEIPEPGH